MKAQARHILVKTAEEAGQLKLRIAKGEAFDVLAKKHSSCPSGKRGGDLGEVRPGQMVGAIDQVIFKSRCASCMGQSKANSAITGAGVLSRLKHSSKAEKPRTEAVRGFRALTSAVISSAKWRRLPALELLPPDA